MLTAAKGHRGAVVEVCPSASTHTFTLLEFAWLLADVPVTAVQGDEVTDRLHSLINLARGQRGLRMPDRDLDLADPYGRRKRAYRKTLAEIDDATSAIIDRLAPSVSRRHSRLQRRSFFPG